MENKKFYSSHFSEIVLPLQKFFALFSSIKITIACLFGVMILVFLGTIEEVNTGIYMAQKKFFRTFFIYWRGIPCFPGGYFLAGLLLFNLLASYVYRFTLNRKKIGIFIIHFGIALLIIAEFITSFFATESQMALHVGERKNYSESLREMEFVMVDTSSVTHDRVISIPEKMLHAGLSLNLPNFPFTLKVNAVYPHSRLVVDEEQNFLGNANTISEHIHVEPLPPVARDDEQPIFTARVELEEEGRSLGTWLLSNALPVTQKFSHQGSHYEMAIRRKRYYYPFSVQLVNFEKTTHPGTEIPKSFVSRIKLFSEKGERQAVISMNQPLRCEGKTLYQASYGDHERLSVLQVVENPGVWLPYLSSGLVAVGLILQFFTGLYTYEFKNWNFGCAKAPGLNGRKRPNIINIEPLTAVQSRKLSRCPNSILEFKCVYFVAKNIIRMDTFVGFLIALFIVITQFLWGEGFDYPGIGRLPIQQDGRVKPLDTVARNALLMIHGKQTVKIDGRKLTAIEWLLAVMMDPDKAAAYPIFRIDHPDILTLIHQGEGKYHAFQDVVQSYQDIRQQAFHAARVDEKQRDSYQRAVIALWQQLHLYIRLNNTVFAGKTDDFPTEIAIFDKAVPLLTDPFKKNILSSFLERYAFLSDTAYCDPLYPVNGDEEWQNMGEGLLARLKASSLHPGIIRIANMTRAYQQNDSHKFNESLSAYQQQLRKHVPHVVKTASFEALYNRLQLFSLSRLFYLTVLLVAITSGVIGTKMWSRWLCYLLVAGFFLHTGGLLARMMIEGRPPVTNLYSSALFVGWGAVFFGLILEKVYGYGTTLAALIGSLTLTIAHHLSGSGDTIEAIQAVLNANFWLSTHVVTITIGYSATLLAGFLGCFYLLRNLFLQNHPEEVNTMGRMLYGIVCVGLFFSFTGTVLGGIWADQSWGRFWGWDPKENGALLIVLWNAIILHVRWGGLVKTDGLMILAVFGNIVTSFSWFGVNMLGVGLHSYGFTDQAFFWLATFMISQLAVIAFGITCSKSQILKSFRYTSDRP